MAPKPHRRWSFDGVGDNQSSTEVLIQWLTTELNYARWTGEPKPVTKEKLCTEVVALMRSHGIQHRNNRDVRNKITELQRSYRAASDWLNSTGKGILERDPASGAATIKAYIATVCKHYDILHPVMRDRPSARPLFTNENVDDAEDEGLPSEEGDEACQDTGDSPCGRRSPRSPPESSEVMSTEVMSTAENAATPIASTSSARTPPRARSTRRNPIQTLIDLEASANEIEMRRLATKEDRHNLEKRKLEMEIAALEQDTQIKRIKVIEQTALARQRLLDNGIPLEEIDSVLPMP